VNSPRWRAAGIDADYVSLDTAIGLDAHRTIS
jgi:hypothetical protein